MTIGPAGTAVRPGAGDAPHGTMTERPEDRVEHMVTARTWLGVAAATSGLAVGAVAALVDADTVAALAWGAATVIALIPAVISSGRRLLARRAGVDVVAVLAMAGALLLGEFLAGAIIAVMLTGGEELERFAGRRARRELTALLDRAPRVAHRREDGALVDIDVDQIAPGDHLVVKGGEVVPADAIVLSAGALLDLSALTGESRPVEVDPGGELQSGAVIAGGAVEARARATAADSTYAGIVRLVEQAESERAPLVRLADRAAGYFVPLTLALAGIAWAVSGSPTRALAVLVVATPCPMILAAPIAIVGGLSTAARHGIIIKGGPALEALGRTRQVLLDKTGTVTRGRPAVRRVTHFGDVPTDEVLRLAAALDQASVHPFAPAIVAAASARGLALPFPEEVHEIPGSGLTGTVDGRKVGVGRLEWLAPDQPRSREVHAVRRRSMIESTSLVFVRVDGDLAGALVLTDPIRPETPRALRALRAAGIERTTLVTGDHADVAELVADALGVDRVLAERSPAEKVDAVVQVRDDGPVLMVGDGINDAPALALADVGVAMGARGATAASEAADVVLTVDRLEGLARAVRIAQRSHRIAWQSIVLGMVLAGGGMVAAAAGLLTPVAGAVLQEVIDLAAIANALRAHRDREPRTRRVRLAPEHAEIVADHLRLAPAVEELAEVADRLDRVRPADAIEELEHLRRLLLDEVLPHELEEEEHLYPAVAAAFGDEDPTGPMSRSHREIARLIRLYDRIVRELPTDGPDELDLADLRRILYGLHAVLGLHVALEDELYDELASDVLEDRP